MLGFASDVSRPDDVENLADTAYEKFGEVSLLMNNAGIGNNPGKPWENRDAWKRADRDQFLGRRLWRRGLRAAHDRSGHARA